MVGGLLFDLRLPDADQAGPEDGRLVDGGVQGRRGAGAPPEGRPCQWPAIGEPAQPLPLPRAT